MRSRLLSLLMVGSMVLGSCTSGDSTGSSLTDVDDQSTTTPASVESTEAAGTDEGGPGVPPLDCRNLLPLDDVFVHYTGRQLRDELQEAPIHDFSYRNRPR